MITTQEDSVVVEVTATLHEWHKIWISLYLDNQNDLFEKIGNIMLELIEARAELITTLKQPITQLQHQQDVNSKAQQINSLKNELINKIDAGNRMLNLDLVPRDANFKQVDPVELSPIKLFRLHLEATASGTTSSTSNTNTITNITSSDTNPLNNPNSSCNNYVYQEFTSHPTINNNSIDSINGSLVSSTQSTTSSIYSTGTTFTSSLYSTNLSTSSFQNSHHLQLRLKSHYLASLPTDQLIEIYFSIVDVYNNNPSTPVTEKFLVQIKGDEIVFGVPNTIFTNIGNLNNRDICLYVQVYRVGKMTLVDGYKTTFGKQQSSQNLQSNSNLNGSTNSVCSATKYGNNNVTMSRQSTTNYLNHNTKYRRPFGSSMVLLKEYTKTACFKETFLGVKVVASNESEFSQLQELYSKRNHSTKLNQNLPNINLDLSIRFISCSQESILRMTDYCITEKRGFPDVVMPGDLKNDLFFTLESAEFEKGGKSISKNIEASISLIDKTGLIIANCISPASNCDKLSIYNSCVFYHSNSPKWNESIKINVPLSEFDSAHIRIEFRHCSTKEKEKRFLGFSFLPLSDEDGTVIADKFHELYLYKCDAQLWEDESLNLCKYTSHPYGPNANNNSNTLKTSNQSNFTHSNREIVTVSTFLLSTKLTQNSDLLNLLRWRELIKRNNRDLEEALKKVLVLRGEEIVKFLQDILDTLFDTFTLYFTSENDYSALIFKVLIHIFLLLEEPKFQHFKPVLDTYASGHFSATLVHKGLLACVQKCLEYTNVVERHPPIQRCFRAIRPLFQFIVQSKLLLSKATGDHNDEPFLNDLRHLFRIFELMLSNNNPNLIPIQVTFLESFPGTLDQLIKVLSAQELAKVVTSLAGSVGFNLPPTLSKAKLIFMKETANSVLIRNQDTRLQITENFCKHLDIYLKHNDELELCHEVLELLIVKIHDYHWTSIYRLYQLTNNKNTRTQETKNLPIMNVIEISMQTRINQIQANQLDLAIMSVSKELEPFVTLLNPLFELLHKLAQDFGSEKILVQKYCTCLLTILKLMGKSSFDHFIKRRKIEYTILFNLFRSIRGIYNRDWSIMQLTSHSILEQPIEEIFRDIRSRNESSTSSRQLSSYIKLLVDFVTHPTLQLEVFSARKRQYILSVFGDLRIKFGNQLMRFWNDLTENNICDLTPTSIQSFLDATLLPNLEIQGILIPVFYDMIDAEDRLKSNSRQIERCLIDYLDLLLNLDKGNLEYADNFETILMTMIEDKTPVWKSSGISLVKSFSRLMRLLIDYRNSLECSDIKSKQMHCLVELSNFYRLQGRTDLHLRYLFKLCDMHLEVGNYVEAAFCLKLYTDEIRWCNRERKLDPIEGFRPEEQEWIRKEALYNRMIHYFDLGKCWEEAISLCKELANFYESQLFDFEKVSSTLKKLASFFDNILTQHRPEREYFRVEFIGSELPDYVRDKEFVYRGGEYERLAVFIQRMKTEFVETQVLNSKTRQSIAKDRSGKYMVISNVKPAPLLKELFKSCQRNMDDKIIHYYLNNRLDTFTYDKPIIKGTATSNSHEGEVVVKNLWIGRYRLKLKKQLPDILPWSEVVSQEYEEISPINHALETISNMNVELSDLILSYKTDPNKQVSPLTMRLQGTIEAAVNGGPSVFVNAFLKRQPGEPENPHEPSDLVLKLSDLIKQQYNILDTGLAVHAKLAPPEVMPLHIRLVEKLQSIYDNFVSQT